MTNDIESSAFIPIPVNQNCFNQSAVIPYGCTIHHIYSAMNDFIDFIGSINQLLHTKDMPRLEDILMAANFSSIVGEFMSVYIPKYCTGIVKNRYHNGHPDLIPANRFPSNAVQYTNEGIEIKASRNESGWQGHNPEECWLMVFVFDSNNPDDVNNGISSKPFRFRRVIGARLERNDWSFSGRSETSRRTITASIIKSGYNKMMNNWIYETSNLE